MNYTIMLNVIVGEDPRELEYRHQTMTDCQTIITTLTTGSLSKFITIESLTIEAEGK